MILYSEASLKLWSDKLAHVLISTKTTQQQWEYMHLNPLFKSTESLARNSWLRATK